MAGIKRRQPDDSAKSDTKKLKSSAPLKADKKFALKLARKEPGEVPPTKSKLKEDNGINRKIVDPKDTRIPKFKSKHTEEPPKKKRRPSPEFDGLDQLNTSESENGFSGFSADGDDDETNVAFSSSGAEDMQVESRQAKKEKFDVKNEQAAMTDGQDGLSKSKEAHAKQKALMKERKAAKPNADEIQRAKKLWERLRRKSHVPKDERQGLVAELFDIVTCRVKDFVFKHDSVRTIQTALKYATMPQRHMIAEELKGNYKTLAESRYAKFLIGKLLVEGDAQIRDLIIPEFYGHVRRLINHPEASWILDDIYRGMATKEQKSLLLREWYGPEFVVFKSADKSDLTATLSEILATNPEKRKPIMNYLHGMINQLIQKKLTAFTILHDAMLQYFLNLTPGSEELTDYLRLIIGDQKEEEVDLLKNLAFTKSGSRVVCLILAHGTAKDRKQILRAYKDVISMLAFDANAHTVLMTAYDVVDDTREISSRIFSELVSLSKTATAEDQHEKVMALANDLTGRISLLYPLAGPAKWLINTQQTQDRIKEIHAIRATTSKKDPQIRRNELITALSPVLLSTVSENAPRLGETSYGCQFLTEVLLSSIGDKVAAVNAVAELASGDPTADEHIAKSPAAARMLKTLIAGGHFDPKEKKIVVSDPDLGFKDTLYENISDWTIQWATGESSFVVVALMEAEGFEQKQELTKKLKGARKELEKIAGEIPSKKVDGEGAKGKNTKKGKGGSKEQGSKGNAGARLLLGMLNAK